MRNAAGFHSLALACALAAVSVPVRRADRVRQFWPDGSRLRRTRGTYLPDGKWTRRKHIEKMRRERAEREYLVPKERLWRSLRLCGRRGESFLWPIRAY